MHRSLIAGFSVLLSVACGRADVTSDAATARSIEDARRCRSANASPDGTLVSSVGPSITDACGHVWAITAGGQVAVNGVVDAITSDVIALAYVGGVVWQENKYQLWWSKTSPSATWQPPGGTATSPLISSGMSPSGGTTSDGGSPSATGHKGVNAGDLIYLSSAALQQRVADFQRLGVVWVRLDFDWSVIQPSSANDFTAAPFDAVATALRDAGINVLGIIDYTPPWANGGNASNYYPPVDSRQYARYAAALAEHFAPLGVHTWEIWNEQNTGHFWLPAADAQAYTAMLQAAYPAIKNADPQAIVVTGGLAQPYASDTDIDARDFLQRMYDAGAHGYFDAVGDHPYDSVAPGETGDNNWEKIFSTTPSFRSIMQANGDSDKKVWITEIGVPTNGGGESVSEDRQAQIVGAAFAAVDQYDWAGPMFWYNDQDWCSDTSNTECFYGLLRADGSQKPSFASYAAAPE